MMFRSTLPFHHSRPSRLQWDRYRQIWFLTQLPMQSIQPAQQETTMSLVVDIASKGYRNAKCFLPWDQIQQAPCLCNPKRPSWQICWLALFRMSQRVRWKLWISACLVLHRRHEHQYTKSKSELTSGRFSSAKFALHHQVGSRLGSAHVELVLTSNMVSWKKLSQPQQRLQTYLGIHGNPVVIYFVATAAFNLQTIPVSWEGSAS
jgi:hypothetical protein